MCGIFGIVNICNSENIIKELLIHLKYLQHRGKDSYGFSYYKNNEIKVVKNLGLIKKYRKTDKNIRSCIGQVRYTTSGNSMVDFDEKEIQPIVDNNNNIGIVHNGNIPNINIHDTTYLLYKISKYLQNGVKIEEALIQIIETIPAAYSVIFQYNNQIFVCMDML